MCHSEKMPKNTNWGGTQAAPYGKKLDNHSFLRVSLSF